MFKINNGYILKSVETPLNSLDKFNSEYALTNQSQYQREVIEIYGNVVDGSVTIKEEKAGVGINIKSGIETAMPLGFMNVKFMSGESTLQINSYKLLPGAQVYVGKEATLNIKNVNMVIYDTYEEKFEYIDPAGTSYKNGSENPYGYMNLHSSWFSSNTQDKGAQFIVAGSVYCDGYIGGTGTIKGSEDGVGKITINNDKATMKIGRAHV